MAHNTDDINIIKLKSVSNEIELGMIRSIPFKRSWFRRTYEDNCWRLNIWY